MGRGVSRLSLWIPAATMLLAPTILKQTGLSAEQYGYVISAFSVAYMLANPLWGRWLDRFGVRVGMIVAVTLWSAA
ncbi:MAG TPA: MFS transporter [Bryobacteraceae bacterium]|nr:MFS transporter [Bryobacteraceae bacterium]